LVAKYDATDAGNELYTMESFHDFRMVNNHSVIELWDALVAKYDATDAGNELYTMESFHDFRMVNNHSVIEQAHEIDPCEGTRTLEMSFT
jgi:hypothetical protein